MSLSPPLELEIFLGRALVGLMFVLAGTFKIMAGPRWFLKTLLAYDLVHGKMAVLLSKGLPWLEVACGIFLILGFLMPFVAIAGFILLLVFAAVVVSAILREKPVDCGCFGRSTSVSRARWTLVYRNIALMGLLLPVYAAGKSNLSVDAWVNLWPNNVDKDVLTQTWLVAVWIAALTTTVGLQVLTRKRTAGQGNKHRAEQVRPGL